MSSSSERCRTAMLSSSCSTTQSWWHTNAFSPSMSAAGRPLAGSVAVDDSGSLGTTTCCPRASARLVKISVDFMRLTRTMRARVAMFRTANTTVRMARKVGSPPCRPCSCRFPFPCVCCPCVSFRASLAISVLRPLLLASFMPMCSSSEYEGVSRALDGDHQEYTASQFTNHHVSPPRWQPRGRVAMLLGRRTIRLVADSSSLGPLCKRLTRNPGRRHFAQKPGRVVQERGSTERMTST